MAAELPALRARGRLHHGHGLTLPAPHASATPLHLRLPHLVHALADLLLEREVLRALERREESGLPIGLSQWEGTGTCGDVLLSTSPPIQREGLSVETAAEPPNRAKGRRASRRSDHRALSGK